jgi:hypothetical protein
LGNANKNKEIYIEKASLFASSQTPEINRVRHIQIEIQIH